jgi:uncharacterized protein YqjF (DUF2071 family)
MLRQDWVDVAFLHWPYDPQIVQERLPSSLKVDTFRGRAWMSVVGLESTADLL